MAETSVGIKLSAEGVSQVEEAFRRVGNSAGGFQKQASGLSTTLKSLAGYAVGLVSIKEIASFFTEGTKAAMENQQVMNLLASRLSSIGVAYDSAKPKVDSFIKSMLNLGRDDEEVANSLGILATRTHDVSRAMDMTKLASDLAASGIGDLSSNTDLLAKVLIGKGQRALLQFGVAVKANASITEQLEAIQKRVTRTTEEWSTTAEGSVARMQTQWKEVKEQLGYGFLITLTNVSNAFNDFYNSTGKNTETWAKFIAEIFNVKIPSAINWLAIKYEELEKLILKGQKFTTKITEEEYNKQLDIVEKTIMVLKSDEANRVSDFEKHWQDLTTVSGKGANDLGSTFEEIADDEKKLADKTKSTFEAMAKSIISSVQDQIDKVSDLRKELDGLTSDTEEQLAKSEENHKKDLKAMARSTQDKIDQIDKQIADTKKSRSQGWRDEIAELETEKEKEKSILARIAGEITDVNTEAQKDDLTILEETHAQEIAEIKAQAEKKQAEIEKEISDAESLKSKIATEVLKPGAISTMVTTEAGLKSWETTPLQNIINLNLNNVTVTDKNLIKSIIDALNRASELSQFSGQ